MLDGGRGEHSGAYFNTDLYQVFLLLLSRFLYSRNNIIGVNIYTISLEPHSKRSSETCYLGVFTQGGQLPNPEGGDKTEVTISLVLHPQWIPLRTHGIGILKLLLYRDYLLSRPFFSSETDLLPRNSYAVLGEAAIRQISSGHTGTGIQSPGTDLLILIPRARLTIS